MKLFRAKRSSNSPFAIILGRCRWHSPTRLYSSTSEVGHDKETGKGDFETFTVTCGAAGKITIDLYNSKLLSKPTTPLFIYLPPTGHHLRENHPPIPSFLLSPSAAVARINYRWNHLPSPPRQVSTDVNAPPRPSPPTPNLLSSHPSYANHPFPTPLHDTLHAFSYLTDSLLPSYTSKSTSNPSNGSPSRYPTPPPTPTKPIQRPLIIYGSYLGGTLATSLALTESITSKSHPHLLAGVICQNGILDWTGFGSSPPLDDLSSPEDFETWDMRKLHKIKTHLFADPAGTFDTFISPVLFFRTAGVNVPPTWPTKEEDPGESEYSDLMVDDMFNSSDSKAGSLEQALTQPSTPRGRPKKTTTTTDLSPAPRKSHLKFPPPRSFLKIPRTLFLVTSPSSSPSPPSSSIPPISNPSSSSKPSPSPSGPKKTKPPRKDKITPLTQAKELGGLMRRSVSQLEFKDRKMWDEDLDPETEGIRRVGVWECGDGVKGTEVEEWIEECLD